MPTTPIAGITYPVNSQPPNAPAQMADMLNRIDSRLIGIFTNAALRDARIPTPEAGMMCYLLDGRHYTIFRAGVWKKYTVPRIKSVPPDSITTPLPTWINTTTRTVVPYLTMPVVAGKTYRLEGALFFQTPAVDYVDAGVTFADPGGMFAMHFKYLHVDVTSKFDINIRRQGGPTGTNFLVGVIDKTPVWMDGVYTCTTSGDLTIAAAQVTSSAVALTMDAGSYWIAKEV